MSAKEGPVGLRGVGVRRMGEEGGRRFGFFSSETGVAKMSNVKGRVASFSGVEGSSCADESAVGESKRGQRAAHTRTAIDEHTGHLGLRLFLARLLLREHLLEPLDLAEETARRFLLPLARLVHQLLRLFEFRPHSARPEAPERVRQDEADVSLVDGSIRYERVQELEFGELLAQAFEGEEGVVDFVRVREGDEVVQFAEEALVEALRAVRSASQQSGVDRVSEGGHSQRWRREAEGGPEAPRSRSAGLRGRAECSLSRWKSF